jgi:uncharacterized protein YceK
LRIIIFIGVILFLLYGCGGIEYFTKPSMNNYGQYDKGTAMCDKGAYGDVNGLCN